jgi:hypothetical protein
MIEIDVQATVVIENGDGAATIDGRPELGLRAMVVTLRPGLEHACAPFF